MRAVVLAGVACLLAASAASAAPVPKEIRKASPSLEGAWLMTETNYGGRPNAAGANANTWVISGEKLTVQYNQAAFAGRGGLARIRTPEYKLTRPEGEGTAAIDWVVNPNGGVNGVYRGVYEVDGDTFRFCFSIGQGKDRPTEVKAGEGVYLYTFKRAEQQTQDK